MLLRRDGVSVLVAETGDGLPSVLHWGADLGPLTDEEQDTLVRTHTPSPHPSSPDRPVAVGLLPEAARGFTGRPPLSVTRGAGRHGSWSPRFTAATTGRRDEHTLEISSTDPDAGLRIDCRLELAEAGVVRLRHRLTNLAEDTCSVDTLTPVLPIPPVADELLDLTGRWCRERSPQRRPLQQGAWVREGRHGRTGHDATLLLVAGSNGFGFGHGQVWGVHTAWSGDHVSYGERLPDGSGWIGAGELLGPGEIVLDRHESYESPWLFAVWSGDGLDGASDRLHRWLRARPAHPVSSRPVVLNSWEAIYHDHDLATLTGLADRAAEVGVERFVLDDGWFLGRDHDRAGLGDWTPDTRKWPNGLHPLVDHVRGLGMEFGLWVEPEMVNPDSELARAHPGWILRGRGELPPSWRHQQVLDLQQAAVRDHLKACLDALLDEYDIAYLKWDHNRDLIDVAHEGRPAVHGQTAAVYTLLDALRRDHPGLEIESCSSGGARVDLGILERADRVWPSDCNDPLERQAIQRWTGLLLPPELMGAHVGPPTAHTTGRTHTLDFRAITALFAHFGIEWDIAGCSADERRRLAEWIALYKAERGLLHSGRVVRAEQADPALWLHGVVAQDGSEGLFAAVQTAAAATSVPSPVCLPGLDGGRHYRVQRVGPEPGESFATDHWTAQGAVILPGAALAWAGVGLPVLAPETGLLLRATQV
ncbi:MAG: alpha-galactosidase [Nocardioidaceae bacterium]